MTAFKLVKINDYVAEIYIEGQKVGHVEKHGLEYIVEVFYVRKRFEKWSETAEGWIESQHRIHVSRIALSAMRLEKYKEWKVQS